MKGNVKRGFVGVDLGVGAVKVAQLVRRRSHWELLDAAIVRRRQSFTTSPEGRSPEGRAVEPTLAEEVLAGVSLADRLQGRRAVGVLSMRPCEFHSLLVDEASLTDEALRHELHAVAAMPWHERTFDAWPISHATDPTGRPTPNLGVISLPISCADQAAAEIASAGLDCRQLDSLPTALARALQMMLGCQDMNLVALDWGYSRGTFCLVREGRTLYVRCLKQSAFSDVIDRVAEAFACSPDHAWELLRNCGVDKDARHQELGLMVQDVVLPFVERLKLEINRTIEYLQSHRRNLAPTGIVLFGVGALLAGLGTWLRTKLELDVRIWQPNPEVLELPDHLPVPVVLLAPALAASALASERS